jgi:hypothetical protein
MNTPDTLVILVTQDTGQRQTKQNKENHTENYKDRPHGTHQKKTGSTHVLAKLNSYCF